MLLKQEEFLLLADVLRKPSTFLIQLSGRKSQVSYVISSQTGDGKRIRGTETKKPVPTFKAFPLSLSLPPLLSCQGQKCGVVFSCLLRKVHFWI